MIFSSTAASKRPPYDTKGRVETLLKRLGDDRTLTFAQRYRYNSLARATTLFAISGDARCRGREEGRDPVSAARANVKKETGDGQSQPFRLFARMLTREVGLVKDLYESLLEAKQRCGESADGLSFPQFHRLIASKSDGLKERHGCDRVRFSVAVEDGHVSFKAKAE